MAKGRRKAKSGRTAYKPEEERMTAVVRFVVTDEDKARIVAAAEAEGVTMSRWLRTVVLGAVEEAKRAK